MAGTHRAAAVVAAGAFSAAGAAVALTRSYGHHLLEAGREGDPELELPGAVAVRDVALRDGGVLHLVETGAGRPVLLLHGANLSLEVWDYQLRDLAPAFRPVAADMRGHGGSVAGAEGVTIGAMARDVVELLGLAGLDDVVLVGHSMGAMVCLRLLGERPDLFGTKVAALVLLGASSGLGPGLPAWRRLTGPVGVLAGGLAGVGVGNLRPARALTASDTGAVASRLGFGRGARPAQVAKTLAMLRAVDPTTFAGVLREVLSFRDERSHLEVSVPVVVAVGSRDHLTPPVYSRRVAAAFADCELRVFKGAGHMLAYERREEVSSLIGSVAGGAPSVLKARAAP